ncbi:3-deoxy-D-manno-octulosonic acid kinase [Idiomarina baltica]|uniref:3-deoxy-D-manno-octulosonic acid kinase n=1 Tax=Idiomarina baltica OS145 TaxID=314276 RepID=A0ABP2CNS1_9GAMM|nr:3-deoxy-D-manno-octulosonic acid kinase [Idiomarina baltica]EAQ31281.1 3-deoxy-D-manno-octulosonic-acid transferase [Idiomarina baltica OS145]
MLRWLYSGVMTGVAPLALAWFYYRGRKDAGYRAHHWERLGRLEVTDTEQNGLLIHTVSVGETIAARQLIQQAIEEFPHSPITISCMTPTARRLIEQSFGDRVSVCYLPIDHPCAVRSFLSKLRPRAIWVMETELWPNLVYHAGQRHIPVSLLNARLSKRSARGYARVGKLMRESWHSLAYVGAQSRATAKRMLCLGVRDTRLYIDGNLKYDVSVPTSEKVAAEELLKLRGEHLVWLAASTHPGEEQAVLSAHQKLLETYPAMLLIWAPRHPERFDEVAAQLQSSELVWMRRSELSDQGVPSDCNVLLADSIGEMLKWCSIAQVTFVGGSLIERGGHNPLEAVAAGSAVVSGRKIFNFAEVYRLLDEQRAVHWVKDLDLATPLQYLFDNDSLRKTSVSAAENVLSTHQGASRRMLKHAQRFSDIGQQMIATFTTKRDVIKFDKDVLPEFEDNFFSAKYWQQKKAIAGNATGRATVWFIQQGDHGMVLRHYYRGGLVGKVNKDKFMREPVERSRAIAEFDLLVKLRNQNLPVPRPIAARMRKVGVMSYTADILVEVIPGAVDVYRLLRERQLNVEQWQSLGAAIRQLHDKNVFHSDLNCHNIMLDDNDKPWIVDFDKCGFREPGEWKKENLDRLLRSLKKEKAKYDTFYWKESRDWPELLTGYEKG